MTKKRGYKIKIVDWGIAYAYGDLNDGTIEINRVLKKHPKLLKMVLKHELQHLRHPSFLDTVKIDLKDAFDFKKQRLLSSSLRKHPLMKLQASMPVWHDKTGWNMNLFLLVAYPLITIVLILVFKLVIW
jgi:hypothetical protein